MKWFFVLVLSLVSMAVSASQVAIQDPFNQTDKFLPHEQAFQFNYEQSNRELKLTWFITPEHYLYADQFTVNGKPIESYSDMPKALTYHDDYFGDVLIYRNEIETTVKLPKQWADQKSLTIGYRGCADAGLCYPPIEMDVLIEPYQSNSESAKDTGSLAAEKSFLEKQSLPVGLLMAFGFGLLLTFTPCVLPMLPIITATVAGVGGQHSSKKRLFTLSMTYVQGMALTYTALGVVVASLGGQIQGYLQHPVAIIAITVIFALLALSMFGLFNLKLPSSIENKIHEKSQNLRGGRHWPVFVIGAISALIVSPCVTAPLTAILVFISETGDKVLGASYLYALSMGMGVPLLLAGTFSRKALPKAGAWMNIVKTGVGVILIGFAVMFLERLLSADVSKYLWFAFWLMAGVILTLSSLKNLSRKKAGIIILPVVVITIIMLGRSLPQEQSLDFIHVKSVTEIENVVAHAATEGKPVMLDLYADWCVACKDFEHKVFSQPDIKKALSGFTLIQIDLTDSSTPEAKAVYARYEVKGLPAILFFDAEGNRLTDQRVSGFMGADDFQNHITNLN